MEYISKEERGGDIRLSSVRVCFFGNKPVFHLPFKKEEE